MNLDFEKYTTYVFDLDGTLYDQPKLRMIMAARLLRYYICHPFRLRDAFVLKRFRSVKEKWDDAMCSDVANIECMNEKVDELDRRICAYVSDMMGKKPEYVCDVVYRWIYINPLTAIEKSKDTRLIQYIARLREEGKRVVILSDYPVEDKLEALGVEADGVYSATQERINELKPSPKGLLTIMQEYNLKTDEVLMIGDRMEKDAEAAKAAGCDYMIVPRKIQNRTDFYREMGM